MLKQLDYSLQYTNFHSDTIESKNNDISAFKEFILLHNLLHKNKTAQILDIGCGMGRFMLALKELGYDNIKGVDIDERQIDAAKKDGLDVIQEDAIEFLKNIQEKYDVIYCMDVLEHLPKTLQMEFLKEINNHLNNDGFCVFQVPNALSPIASRMRYSDFTHTLVYTTLTMSFLLNNIGLYNIVYRPQYVESKRMLQLKAHYAEILNTEASHEQLILTKNIVTIVFKQKIDMEKYLQNTPKIINNYLLKDKRGSLKNYFLKNIFSIKNEYKNNKKHKVLTIFGVKFKIRI